MNSAILKKPPISEWEFSTCGLQVVQLMEDDPADSIVFHQLDHLQERMP